MSPLFLYVLKFYHGKYVVFKRVKETKMCVYTE